ncbi:MAG: sensor histidine kinase [Actinomycetota bacterium]
MAWIAFAALVSVAVGGFVLNRIVLRRARDRFARELRAERERLVTVERDLATKLEDADRLEEDFIATISHELRTPLTSIKGYANTLLNRERELTQEERTAFLEILLRQCDRLAKIVDTFLLVSRLEAGELEGKRSYIGLADLLRDAAEAASDEDRFEFDVDRSLGLVSDHFRVFHIVRNLMENACKYSPRGSAVRVVARPREIGFEVEIVDQGPGVRAGDVAKIFDRFSRGPGGDGPIPSGTGLGLYIARRFADDVGAEIVVGRGTEPPWTGASFKLRVVTG